MSTLDELINKLPEWMQPFAARYANLFIDKSFEDLEALAFHIADGQWQPAYQRLIKGMNTEDLLAELQRLNEENEKQNGENATFIDLQRNVFRNAILVGLSLAKAKTEIQ